MLTSALFALGPLPQPISLVTPAYPFTCAFIGTEAKKKNANSHKGNNCIVRFFFIIITLWFLKKIKLLLIFESANIQLSYEMKKNLSKKNIPPIPPSSAIFQITF